MRAEGARIAASASSGSCSLCGMALALLGAWLSGLPRRAAPWPANPPACLCDCLAACLPAGWPACSQLNSQLNLACPPPLEVAAAATWPAVPTTCGEQGSCRWVHRFEGLRRGRLHASGRAAVALGSGLCVRAGHIRGRAIEEPAALPAAQRPLGGFGALSRLLWNCSRPCLAPPATHPSGWRGLWSAAWALCWR